MYRGLCADLSVRSNVCCLHESCCQPVEVCFGTQKPADEIDGLRSLTDDCCFKVSLSHPHHLLTVKQVHIGEVSAATFCLATTHRRSTPRQCSTGTGSIASHHQECPAGYEKRWLHLTLPITQWVEYWDHQCCQSFCHYGPLDWLHLKTIQRRLQV